MILEEKMLNIYEESGKRFVYRSIKDKLKREIWFSCKSHIKNNARARN